ncbi:MAG: hypothetical protein ACM31P_03945 [Actinomycetota bacterium]
MNKLTKTAIALTLVGCLTGNAFADWGHRPYNPGPRYEHKRDHGSDWVGPAIALGIIGLAVGAALSDPAPAPSPPAYAVAPAVAPPPPAVPANAQYFCRSVGQYYPNTQYCPEGWQLVYPY